jgi:hypothetical protein
MVPRDRSARRTSNVRTRAPRAAAVEAVHDPRDPRRVRIRLRRLDASRRLAEVVPARTPFFGLAAAFGVVSWFAILLAAMRRFDEKVSRRVLTWIIRAMGVLPYVLAIVSAWDFVRWVLGEDRGIAHFAPRNAN